LENAFTQRNFAVTSSPLNRVRPASFWDLSWQK